MSGPFVVCHVSEAVGLDVLVRTSVEAVALREVRCSGPSAHLVHLGALRLVNVNMPRGTRAQIDRALHEGTHPALAGLDAHELEAVGFFPPVDTNEDGDDGDDAEVLEQRVAEPAPAPAPPSPVAPPPKPRAKRAPRMHVAKSVELCTRCGRAPRMPGEHSLWCEPCRELVLRSMRGRR